MIDGFKLDEEERAKAMERAREQQRYTKDGFVCIGGIGRHGRCSGHGPGKYCPYCIKTEEDEGNDVRVSR